MCTSFQSLSLVFSTMAQPWMDELAIGLDAQTIAGLPDGMLDDVADLDGAFALAGEVEADRFLLHVVRGGQDLQGPLKFTVESRVQKTHGQDLIHADALNARFAGQVQHLLIDKHGFVADDLPLDFHADDGAEPARGLGIGGLTPRDGRGSQRDLDLLAAGLVENLAQRGIVVEIEGEAVQDLVDGIVAVVVDAADGAAALVLEDHALERSLMSRGGKGEIDVGVAVHEAVALEVADAAVEQDDVLDGQGRFRRLAVVIANALAAGPVRTIAKR